MIFDINSLTFKIKLTPEEMEEADQFSQQVLENNKKHNRKYRVDKGKGYTQEQKGRWIKQGFRTEKAISKMFNLPWHNVMYDDNQFYNKDDRPLDIEGMEIRSISDRKHSLLIQKWDKDNVKYLCVLVNKNEFELLGWCYGIEGKKEQFYKDTGHAQPCYYVPQTLLRTPLELYVLLHKKEHLISVIKERLEQKRKCK